MVPVLLVANVLGWEAVLERPCPVGSGGGSQELLWQASERQSSRGHRGVAASEDLFPSDPSTFRTGVGGPSRLLDLSSLLG